MEGFSSGSLSPVSSYYNSDSEPNEEELGVEEEFRNLLKNGDNSKICKFIESWESQQPQAQPQQIQKRALHLAIEEKCKDIEVFKTLLRVGCDPLEVDSNHKTALTILLEQKEFENDDEDCTISTLLGEWELRRAATKDSKIFRLIHSRNWKDLYSFLLTSSDPVKLLCKVDAKYAGISPIHEIAALNDVTTMKKILKKFKGIDLNVKAIGSGNTPLHEATHLTSAEMVNFLLENGAKCDVKNAAGKIPAHLGTEKIQVIIEIKNMTTLQADADSKDSLVKPKKTTMKSDSSDSLSREERKLKQIIGFLDQIESNDNDREVDSEYELEGELEGGVKRRTSTISNNLADLESVLQREVHSGRTILHRFARRNQSEKLLKFLKDHDFDESKCKLMKIFEVIDNSGSTPLHDAAAEGSLEAAKIFLFGSRAAKAKNLLIDPSIPAAITGDTPLHAAASSGNTEIVELLLAVGADKEAVNIEGKKAIDVTISKNVKKLLNPKESDHKKEAAEYRDLESKLVKKEVNTKINDTTNNNSIADVPVKRGPGRPRKYPRPDEPIIKISKTESVKIDTDKETTTTNNNCSSSPLSSVAAAATSLQNFSFTDIEKDSCIILIRFKEEWLMLKDQFQQILSHLHLNINNNIINTSNTNSDNLDFLNFTTATQSDKQLLSSLPKIGNLISLLQSREEMNFVPKTLAMQLIEKEFRVHLTGPFGYIDIPRIRKRNADTADFNTSSSGCPLKLKMKLEKEQQQDINSKSYWLTNTKIIFEEQKSPKNFQM